AWQLARLPHAAPPALHGMAPELRRDRRVSGAARLYRPAGRGSCGVLPRSRRGRARARRAPGPSARDPHPRRDSARAHGDLLRRRGLSTPVRHVRRQVVAVSGTIELRDGEREPVTPELFYQTQERSLQLLAAAHVCLAGALLVLRLT